MNNNSVNLEKSKKPSKLSNTIGAFALSAVIFFGSSCSAENSNDQELSPPTPSNTTEQPASPAPEIQQDDTEVDTSLYSFDIEEYESDGTIKKAIVGINILED